MNLLTHTTAWRASLCAALLTLPLAANADVLAEYTITGSSFASTDADPLSTASDLTSGPGGTLVASTTNATWGNPGQSAPVAALTNVEGDKANALLDGHFATFTLDPNSGFAANLTSLTYYARSFNNLDSPRYFLRSSVDGYTADLADSALNSNNTTAPTITLSGSEFQNLQSPVTFRFYGYGARSGSSIRFDNVVLNGTLTVIPEPSTLAFMGGMLGLLLFNGWRRRRR